MSADSPAALLINAAGTEIATNANPVRVDPTGTTAQPITDNGGSLTVDGTVAVSGSVAVTGPLTDAQLRAAAVPISAAALPLPTGAATETTLALIKAKTDNLDVLLSTRAVTGLTDAQLRASAVPVSGPLTDAQLRAAAVPVSAASLPLPAGAATAALQTQPGVDIGDVTVNNAAGAAAVNVQDGGNSITVDATSLPLPTGAATEATLATRATEATLALIKAKTDNLDVALSTRAEKAQLPAALVGGRLDQNVGAWLGSTAPTVGQKAMVASVPVVLANNHSAVPVTFTPANARTGVSFANLALGGGTAGTLQVIRATVYTEPSSAAQRSVASSSANDTAAGTGARTLRLTYFDNTGDGPFTEDITLNGTTAVNTVSTTIRFIESMVILTDGSVGANVGTITLYSTTAGGGTVIGTIGIGTILPAVGDNQTLWAHHYVPTGWVVEVAVLVAAIQSGGSGTSGKFLLRAAKPLIADTAETLLDGVLLLPGSFSRSFDFHTRFTGFARLTCYGIPSVNNTELAASFDWSEVPV